ncbi:MAG: response regulator [Selenomonadaceae bacterium]|nr:response regulator [Selenomonadaceae bacterium]MBR1858032.1 response regulator [Selenomonadaceae bacterium]
MSAEQIEGNVILVIDDDEINLQMAKMILEKKLPCRVITCDNGVQGIEIMRRQYVKLVLLDIMMPFFNGIQTLEKMREDPKLKNMPVIMLTASTDKQHISKAIQFGVKDYVRKPFMPDELVGRVSKRLGPITTKSTYTILVVDDDPADLKRATLLMESHLPHKIVTASSGIEGMEFLRKHKINMVVASTEMSFINGFRIVDFIRGDANLKNIPAFLITSSTDPEVIDKIDNSGAKGYIKKPLVSVDALEPIVNFLKKNK